MLAIAPGVQNLQQYLGTVRMHCRGDGQMPGQLFGAIQYLCIRSQPAFGVG